MATSPLDVVKIYVAYFGRAPDTVGLAYWSERDSSAIAAAFGASPEFQSQHGSQTTAQLVQSIYHNAFGRAAETSGVNYWSALVDSGAIARGDLPARLALAGQGGDGDAMDYKAAAALAFTSELDTAAEILAYQSPLGASLSPYFDRVSDEASLLAFKALVPDMLAFLDGHGGLVRSGQLQAAGYLQGATVFRDANGNGVQDQNELGVVTDSQGRFVLIDSLGDFPSNTPSSRLLTVTGGTDAATGLAHHGSYTVGVETKAVNALSSLHAVLVQQGLSAGQASARLDQALALNGADVNQSNPLFAAFEADALSPAAIKSALHQQAAVASVDSLQLAIAQTLVSLAGGNAKLSEAQALRAVEGALADTLAHAAGASDLGSASFITALFDSSVAKAANTGLSTAAAALGAQAKAMFGLLLEAGIDNIEAGAAGSGGIYGGLAHIGQATSQLQGTLAGKLAAAMAAGHPETLLSSYLGAALANSTPAVHLGDIDPATKADQAAIDAANSGANVPHVNALDIGKLYLAFLHRPAEPQGETFWQHTGNIDTLANAIALAPEFISQFAGKDSHQITTELYHNLFGRAPEPDGLKFWSAQLDSGKLTTASLALGLTRGAQGNDIVALADKAVAAAEFTAALNTPALEAAYSQSQFNWPLVRAWIDGVKDDATLASAMAALPELIAKLDGNTGPLPPHATLVGVADSGGLYL
jgi:hypothetical protein